MIDRNTIDKIMDSVDIVDVISDFVSLRKRGVNYIACCPFHNEKTPSFSVSPSKGIFKCFGCGKAGNAVTFIMEHEQMTYVEALKYLGKKYGIEVRDVEENEEEAADRLKRESMLLVSEYAAAYFTKNLFETQTGRSIGLSYFKERRGFTEETIRKFGLGYAPTPGQLSFSGESLSTLGESAIRDGYKREYLLSTGLCMERGSGQLVDKFAERVIFPIYSLSGRVIAFGGRTLREDKSVAKYLNSPESEIYHKSRSLYGIYFAKSAIAKEQKCYLVEGYTDVISLHQAGLTNVVASSGTSLTTDQIRLIRRFTSRITVLYDGDAAGIKASIRGIDMLLEEGLEVKVVLLPDGEDPDSFARSHSIDEIKYFLDNNETDFIDFKYKLFADTMEKDPIRKAELIREIVNTIAVIPDPITRSVYIEQTSGKLALSEKILYQEIAKIRSKKINDAGRRDYVREKVSPAPENNVEVKPIVGSVPILDASEKELLYYMLKFGECTMILDEKIKITVSKYIETQLREDDLILQNPLYKKIFDEYYIIADEERNLLIENNETADPDILQGKIQQRFINGGDKDITQFVLSQIIEDYHINIKEYLRSLVPERTVIAQNVPKAVLVYKLKCTEQACNMTSSKISEMQNEGDVEAQKELMKQLKIYLELKNILTKELHRFN